MHVHLCTTCMPDTCGGQKKASDTLKLELQTAVSYYVGVGNETWVVWKRRTAEPSLLSFSLNFEK